MMLHFIGFRGDEYSRALRVFGKPDFFHSNWDLRAQTEIAPGDTVVFAKVDDKAPPKTIAHDDSARF